MGLRWVQGTPGLQEAPRALFSCWFVPTGHCAVTSLAWVTRRAGLGWLCQPRAHRGPLRASLSADIPVWCLGNAARLASGKSGRKSPSAPMQSPTREENPALCQRALRATPAGGSPVRPRGGVPAAMQSANGPCSPTNCAQTVKITATAPLPLVISAAVVGVVYAANRARTSRSKVSWAQQVRSNIAPQSRTWYLQAIK